MAFGITQIRFAIDGITAFSDIPLRLVTISGFVVSGFAFLVMAYALISRFIWQDYTKGWTSTLLSVMFIGGIQLIAIGIIGEYINRIGHNVRQRSLYVVGERSEGRGERGEERGERGEERGGADEQHL